MKLSESNSSQGIMSFIASLPLIRRIKIIKELIFEKLDQLSWQWNILDNKATSIDDKVSSIEHKTTSIDDKATLIDDKATSIDHKTNSLLEKTHSILTNNTSLLQTVISIIEIIQIIYQDSKHHYKSLSTAIKDNYQQIQSLIQDFQARNSQLNDLDAKVQKLVENSAILLQTSTQINESLKESQENTKLLQSIVTEIRQESQKNKNQIMAVVEQIRQESQTNNKNMLEIVESIRQQSRENQHKLSDKLGSIITESKRNNSIIDIQLQEIAQESKSQQEKIVQELKFQQEKIEQVLENSQHKLSIIHQSSTELARPEIGLMSHLYSFLPSRYAIDIGANVGNVSESLLKAGYEVYAFEPFKPVYDKLTSRLSENSNFHSYQIALGSQNETRELHIASDNSQGNIYDDPTLYSSLLQHSMPDDLPFTDTTTVEVKTLASLHHNREIPANISLVKIDTEGFDLEVIRGMEFYKYPVIVTEFWDEQYLFGRSGTFNKLEDLVEEMQKRGYYWYIVLYTVWGSTKTAFYCNYPQSVENSWGNIFFFQDYQIFAQAYKWCSAIIPIAYFNK